MIINATNIYWEVKWVLGKTAANKASGGDGIPTELFKILKDDAIKVLFSVCQQIWKTQSWPQDWKRSIFIPVFKYSCTKERSNYWTIAIFSHVSKCAHSLKVMLRIIQARLQQYLSREFPDVQAGFRKGIGNRDQIANICWIIEKARNSRKTSTSVSLTTLKPLTGWIITNCGELLKRWEYQTPLPVS